MDYSRKLLSAVTAASLLATTPAFAHGLNLGLGSSTDAGASVHLGDSHVKVHTNVNADAHANFYSLDDSSTNNSTMNNTNTSGTHSNGEVKAKLGTSGEVNAARQNKKVTTSTDLEGEARFNFQCKAFSGDQYDRCVNKLRLYGDFNGGASMHTSVRNENNKSKNTMNDNDENDHHHKSNPSVLQKLKKLVRYGYSDLTVQESAELRLWLRTEIKNVFRECKENERNDQVRSCIRDGRRELRAELRAKIDAMVAAHEDDDDNDDDDDDNNSSSSSSSSVSSSSSSSVSSSSSSSSSMSSSSMSSSSSSN